MTLYQKLRLFIDKHAIRGAKATWSLFILYALVLFITVVVAQWFYSHGILLSSLFSNPLAFFTFWTPKVCIVFFLASFTLITNRKWWTVVLLLLISIWIIANLLYQQSHGCPISGATIMMANTLKGFEDSIYYYWNTECTFFLILTTLYALLVPFFKPCPVNKKNSYSIAVSILLLYFIGAECYRRHLMNNMDKNHIKTSFKSYIPFYVSPSIIENVSWRGFVADTDYLQQHSFISFFPMMITSYIAEITNETYLPPSEGLKKLINNDSNQSIVPTYNVIFLLVESLESFALEAKDNQGNYFMPNMQAMLEQNNVAFANKIKSQMRHGGSSDGQMIVTTGMLPLQNGVAAVFYSDNIYPNYGHFYEISALSNPCWATAYNQDIITHSFGFQQMLTAPWEIIDEHDFMTDAQTFEMLDTTLQAYPVNKSFCYFALTYDSHTPFRRHPHNSQLDFDIDMPCDMQNYLNTLHYTDSCFGKWYNTWKNSTQAINTILVITSDHVTFKGMGKDFIQYGKKVGLTIANGETYCPLIIQAPQIEENMQITDVCYQMDVYPTILHLIGCEEYFWKGFGVNLLDSTARHNRPITEEQAYALSDKMIRADYFRHIVDSLGIPIKDREPIFEP